MPAGAFAPQIERPGCEGGNSFPFSANVKNW
jgi:hypothetical protein